MKWLGPIRSFPALSQLRDTPAPRCFIGDPKKGPKFLTCTGYLVAGCWQFNFAAMYCLNSPVNVQINRLINAGSNLRSKSNCIYLF
jgi:hypothetical protein